VSKISSRPYRALTPLGELRKNPDKTTFDDEEKEGAFCHFERERKYVAVSFPFTSRICLFNTVIKSDIRCKEFDVILLWYLDVSVSQIVAGENPAQVTWKTNKKQAANQNLKYFLLLIWSNFEYQHICVLRIIQKNMR